MGLEGIDRPTAGPGVVGLEFPAHDVVGELERQHVVEPLLMLRMVDGHQDFDPAIEVARHQVGRADQVVRPVVDAAVGESVDPTVLEIATEDAPHTNVLREPRHPGPQTRDPPHDHVDAHTGGAGGVERLDHLGVADRVALEGDVPVGCRSESLAR